MNKKKKGRLVLGILTAAIGINLLAFGGVYAYQTAQDTAKNAFTVGENVTTIEETYTPPEELNEGEIYTKIVSIKNQGSVLCYVRVFAEIEDPDMASSVEIDWNREDWTEKQADGYYYYKRPLAVGETTEPLFTTLTAIKNLEEFRMMVYEESTQAEGYTAAQDAFASYSE